MASKIICSHFARGKCSYGANCKFSHESDGVKPDLGIGSNSYSRVCRFYQTPRGCAKGNACTYSHESSDTTGNLIAQTSSSSPIGSSIENSERLKFEKWCAMIRMRQLSTTALARFFQLALEIATAGDANLIQQVYISIATEGGLLRIDELVSTPSGHLSLEAKLSRFKELYLPFFLLITHEEVTASRILESHLGTVYNFLFGPNGTRAVPFFEHVTAVLFDIKLDAINQTHFLPASLSSTLAVLSKLIDVNQTACVIESFQQMAETLTALFDENEKEMKSGLMMQAASRSLKRIRLRLGLGSSMPQVQDHPVKSLLSTAVFELEVEKPGRLSKKGPRHSNDHVDICDIQILPTSEEIESDEQDYLPVTDPSQWHIAGMKGLLDRHFRLLREDTIGQLRNAVRLVIQKLRKDELSQREKTLEGARVFVYKKVSLIDFKFDQRKGIEIMAEFDQPPLARQLKTGKQRAEFWSESKQLLVDSLLCMTDAEGRAMFFTVLERKCEYKVASEPSLDDAEKSTSTLWDDALRASITLHPVDSETRVIHMLLEQFEDQEPPKRVFVEFPGVLLPSFRPTLQALQKISRRDEVPFSDILAPTNDWQVQKDVPPPVYALRRGFQFDLSSITNGVPLFLSPQDRFDIQALKEHSTLDDAQCTSFVHALTKSLAPIQGPPGSGKTYIGGRIMKVLLANRDAARLGPLICVCYTNHALDQILLHLKADGCNQIIRVGSRSKSEELEQHNLITVCKAMELTKAEKKEGWSCSQELEMGANRANGLLEDLMDVAKRSEIMDYLGINHYHHYQELYEPDDDGFQVYHHKQDDVVQYWLDSGPVVAHGCARSIEELLGCSLFGMSRGERRILYDHWIADRKSDITQQLLLAHETFEDTKRRYERSWQERQLRCLRQAHVIGLTTTGLAKNLEMLERLSSKVMLCEEAGEVLEAHILTTLLPSIEHCILIGDHQQLRPQIQSYDLSVESWRGKNYALDTSLFERLILPSHMGHQIPYSSLQIQRRMHPSISTLIRDTLYEKLKDHEDVSKYPEVVGIRRRLYWLDHHVREEGNDSSQPHQVSRSNDYEVEVVAALVSHLVRQGAYQSDQIAVLTPYLLQLRKIRKRLGSSFEIVIGDRDLEEMEKQCSEESQDPLAFETASSIPVARKTTLLNALRVATVDNFQGEEAKVVIITLVRCNENRSIGFLKTSNRINVLLSRAQHGMFIIGSAETARHVPMWEKVISIFEQNGNIGPKLPLCCQRHPNTTIEVSTPDDFVRLAPEGGCNVQCGLRLSCGHACLNKCHILDLHNAVTCLEECKRPLPGCDHPCSRPCGKHCDEICRVIVKDVVLPCKHTAKQMQCHEAQNLSKFRCRHKVDRQVPGCDHKVNVDCHLDVSGRNFRCPAVCHKSLPQCAHSCLKACYKCTTRDNDGNLTTNHRECTTPCGRPFSTCAHACPEPCHGDSSCPPCGKTCEVRCVHSRCSKKCHEPCSPCAQDCTWGCKHRGKCGMPCAVPCDILPCSERCQEKLDCGHQCPSICGEICPSQRFCQQCAPSEIKDLQVDYILGLTYAEVDLDESPVIIARCGHIMTVESFDGRMGMADHYDFSVDDTITGLKASSEPFSQEVIRNCPMCRGPLRDIARYNRIVKRGLIDESTKKFIVLANAQFVALEARLHEQELQLQTSRDQFIDGRPTEGNRGVEGDLRHLLRPSKRNPELPKMQNLVITGTQDVHFNLTLRQQSLAARYGEIIHLRKDLRQYLKQVDEVEQPFGRVYEMVQNIRRRRGVIPTNTVDDTSLLQIRNRLLATVLVLRCDLALLSDFVNVVRAGRRPELQFTSIKIDLSKSCDDCLKFIAESERRVQPMHQIEGLVFFAGFVAIQRFAPHNMDETAPLVTQARQQLLAAREICRSNPSTGSMSEEIEGAFKMLRHETFYSEVTNAEKRAVYAAMAREFRGTGHWYYCQNGHPFTIGECGMPMETSKCPQCGAAVGGNHHQSVDGVQEATDFERQMGELAI